MNRFKIRFGVILAILLTITICSACGPGAEPTPPTPTPTPPPSANQPPEISSLTPAQTQAYPSDMIEIQCNASDTDGDTISYEWSTTGGKFTGTGPTVSWVAPEQYGDYTITVIVKDGKGGIAQTTVTMSVVRNMDPVIS
ncbi:MAG TPA: PKD domain-containing protein, partial [Dehalococcoidia bacterium]|nr:PKD domain-containing protein [Dehalococcoidia bacterium]